MKLIELELESETPIFLGSYDTQFHAEDAFRTQSLKGLWRWWLRAYIAGAMYRLGFLHSGRSTRYVAELDKGSRDFLLQCTQQILGGLGESSHFRIVISEINIPYRPNQEPCCPTTPATPDHCKPQRVKLLTLGNRTIAYTDKLSVKLSIELTRELSYDEIFVSLSSLLTGLSLDGLGKISRRGFGTFKIKVHDDTGMFNFILNKDKTINLDKLPELIRQALSKCEDVIRERLRGKLEERKTVEPPPMPAICDTFIPLPAGLELYKNVEIKEELPIPQIMRNRSVPVFSIYQIRFREGVEDVTDAIAELEDFFFM